MALATLVVMAVLTKGCHETSPSQAVGLAHCTSFGRWNTDGGFEFAFELPRLGFGWSQLVLDRDATDVCRPAGKSCPTLSRLPAGALGAPRLSMASFEVALPVLRWGPLWFGPAFGFAAPPGWSSARNTPLGQTRLGSPQVLTVGGMFGAELRLRRVGLHAGLLLADASLSLDAVTSTYQQLRESWFSAQLRAGFEVWVTEGLALGAAAGVDLLRTDHLSASVFIVVPLRSPFAGLNSVW